MSWQRNHKEAEAAEKSGQQDPGWNKVSRILLPDAESPPICHNHLGRKQLRSMAFRVVWQQIQGEPTAGKGPGFAGQEEGRHSANERHKRRLSFGG
jgi:hypothetical protein